jgi:hypothetical protein
MWPPARDPEEVADIRKAPSAHGPGCQPGGQAAQALNDMSIVINATTATIRRMIMQIPSSRRHPANCATRSLTQKGRRVPISDRGLLRRCSDLGPSGTLWLSDAKGQEDGAR